jgi:MFS family permease
MDLLSRVRDEMAFEGNIWKSYVYRFLMEFQLWLPIWVLYLQQTRGLTLTQISVLDTPFWLLIVFAEVPTGAVADRFGRKTSLALGALMFAVAIFVFGIADSYAIILISYSAWALAVTFQSGADAALMYDSLKQAGREGEFQKITGRLWAVRTLAALLALLIGAPIASATSLAFPVVVSAAIALAAVPIALSMHEPRHDRDDPQENYFTMVREGMRDAWRRPALRYVIMFSGVLNAATFAPMIFVQPYLTSHGVSLYNLGFFQAPVRAAGIVAALLAYRFVARAGRRAAFFAMPVTLAVCYFFLAGVDHVWVYVLFLPVGMVAGMQSPVLATYINERIPSARRATILSVQSVAASILLAGLEPLGGIIADGAGLRAMFLAFALMAAIAGPLLLLLWAKAEAAEDVEAGGASTLQPEAVPVS